MKKFAFVAFGHRYTITAADQYEALDVARSYAAERHLLSWSLWDSDLHCVFERKGGIWHYDPKTGKDFEYMP